MRAMVVEVVPEIEQLVFEVCRRPEQRVIQIFAPNGAVMCPPHLSDLERVRFVF
jgi:hypothetical protein